MISETITIKESLEKVTNLNNSINDTESSINEISLENELFEYLSIDIKNFPKASRKLKNPIMTKEYFDKLTEKFRSPHLWYYSGSEKKWKLRKTVFNNN